MKLEPLASKLAVNNLDSHDLDKMRELVKKMDSGTSRAVSQMIHWNYDFHRIFIYKCGNDRLIKMLEGLQQQFKRATVFSFSIEGRTQEVSDEHNDLLKAFEVRDPEKVEKVVEKHVYNGWQFIKEQFNSSQK